MQEFRTNTERDMDVIDLPLPGEGEDQDFLYEQLMEELENEARWEAERDRVDMLVASVFMPVLPGGGQEEPF